MNNLLAPAEMRKLEKDMWKADLRIMDVWKTDLQSARGRGYDRIRMIESLFCWPSFSADPHWEFVHV